MRIFLTGATGFVGRHLVPRLRMEHEVHVLAPRPAGDLGKPLDARLLPPRVDVVIHAAGLVGATDARAEVYVETNVTGTLNVARAARAMEARRFILLSTGGVYRPSANPLTESSEIAPQGAYAISKWEGEQVALALRSDMHVQILRLFFPYGPGQQRERLIPRLFDRVSRGEAVFAANGEGPRLNPIFIDDLVESIRRLLAIDDDLVVNLAGGETVSIREIAEQIGRLAGVAPNVVATSEVPQSWVAGIAHAVQLTGYTPRVSMEEGLRRTSATIS